MSRRSRHGPAWPLCLGLTAALLAGPACSDAASGDRVIAAIWPYALTAAARQDEVAVATALEPAMQASIFSQLSKQRQYDVAHLYAQATQVMGKWQASHDAYARATASSQATREDWDGRLLTAILVADARDAYLALQHLSVPGKSVLSSFDGDMVRRLNQLIRDVPEPGASLAVGQQLEMEAWTSPYAYQDLSDVWLHYAEALLGWGETNQAIRAARHITDPVVIMAMQADRRFDPIVAAVPALRDAHQAAERNLRRAQDFADLHPETLDGTLAVARALTTLDRRGEALNLLQQTSETVAGSSPSTRVYDDMELAGVLRGWISALQVDAGRLDEALPNRLAAADGNGDPYAAMNVARTYLYAGKAAEAWRWIQRAPGDGLGPDERMSVVMYRACIASAQGDQGDLAEALEYLRTHEAWMPQARIYALLCSDQTDRAEEALLAQLANPRTRLAALGVLQSTAHAPTAPSFLRKLDDQMSDLADRARVKAAIDQVGRRQKFDLVVWVSVS